VGNSSRQCSQLRLSSSQILSILVVKMKGPKAKVEQKLAGDKKTGKRKPATDTQVKRQIKKEKKAKKDPNKPKRPPSAFFVFLDEFRKEYKQANPNANSVSAVGKAGGEKWRALSDADKAPYVAKAEKKKAEYEKSMATYNKQKDSNTEEVAEESDKSKSEVNDEEEDESGEEDDEE